MSGGLVRPNPRLQSSGRIPAEGAGRRVRQVELRRQPHIWRRVPIEPRGRDAQDLGWGVIDPDGPSNQRLVGAVSPRPQPVADHGHARSVGTVFLRAVGSPARERNPERREIAVRRDRGVDHLGQPRLGDVHATVLEQRQVLEHAVVFLEEQEQIWRKRELRIVQPGRGAPHVHEAVRVRIRQRLEQDAVDDAEDRGRGGNAERQRQRRDEQELRFLAQGPCGFAEVMGEYGVRRHCDLSYAPATQDRRGRACHHEAQLANRVGYASARKRDDGIHPRGAARRKIRRQQARRHPTLPTPRHTSSDPLAPRRTATPTSRGSGPAPTPMPSAMPIAVSQSP